MESGDEPPERSSGNVATVVLAQFTLFMLIGGMAGTTDINGLVAQLTNLKGIGTGFGCQFLLLPLLGYLSTLAFQLDPVYGIMLLLTTTSPGGGFSGFWCSLCNADIALSIAMTTVSTFASIVMLPANVALYVSVAYGRAGVQLDLIGVAVSIAVVIAAIFTGVFCGTVWPDYRTLFNRVGSVGGMCNIFLAIFSATAGSGTPDRSEGNEAATESSFIVPPLPWYFAVSAPCILGLIIAFMIARSLRCTRPESVAICIECCFQNTGLANSVALTIFTGADAARAILVPLWYGVTEIVVLSLFGVVAWRVGWTYAESTEPALKCLLGNYQPPEVDMDRDQPEWVTRVRIRTQDITERLRIRIRRSIRRLSVVVPTRISAHSPAPATAEPPAPADRAHEPVSGAGDKPITPVPDPDAAQSNAASAPLQADPPAEAQRAAQVEMVSALVMVREAGQEVGSPTNPSTGDGAEVRAQPPAVALDGQAVRPRAGGSGGSSPSTMEMENEAGDGEKQDPGADKVRQ